MTERFPKLLHGKKIFITGGTSRLGAALVERACAEGAQVFFSYHTQAAKAQRLAGLGARPYPLDLTDSASFAGLVRSLAADAVSLDAVVHNAAAVRDATLQSLSEEDWDLVLNADLRAPALLTARLLPLLTGRPSGAQAAPAKILFLTSRAAVRGIYGAANYAAAKAGIIGLVKSLAAELAAHPILVNAVNPGFMLSPMTENLPEKVIAAQRAASPLGALSRPEEVADFMVYLLSDRMSQVTGQVFHWESRWI